MRASTIVLAILPTVAWARGRLQARQDIPPCINECITSAAAIAQCSVGAVQCLCTSQTFVDEAAKCYIATCSPDLVAQGVALGQELCSAVGVSVAVPSSILAEASGSAGATASSAASASASSTPVPSSAASSNVASVSSILSSVSSAAPSSIASLASAASSSLAPSSSARSAGNSLKTPLLALGGVAAVAALAL